MKRLDAYKEAARRDGHSETQIKEHFEKAALEGILPPRWNEEIPAGEEEALIMAQLQLKREVSARIKAGDPVIRERMMINWSVTAHRRRMCN